MDLVQLIGKLLVVEPVAGAEDTVESAGVDPLNLLHDVP